MGSGSAPGKAILAGEHFVLYGTAAVAVPLLGREVRVEVEEGEGPWVVDDRIRPHLNRMLAHLGVVSEGLVVRVESTLPMGAGLGGSAALAVALVQALRGNDLQPAQVRAQAHELERLAHGTPSGVDDAVATWRRPVHLTATRDVQILDLLVPSGLWLGLTPERTSTLEAVERVAALAAREPDPFAELVAQADAVCQETLTAWGSADWPGLGAAMTRGHGLLQAIGVSTPSLDRLVEVALSRGAWGAKLTGGGLGGAVVALAPPDVDLSDAWCAAGAQEVITP